VPANLPPQYIEAEQRFRAAKTDEEKIARLQEMMAIIPKHKGTEKIRADLKTRLSKLRKGAAKKKSAASRRPQFDHVEREGAGQVALVGAPNAGKSALLGALTGASPEIAPYPYTTHRPAPGMMPFENIQIQLIDTPPIARDVMENWLPSLVRKVDLVLLVVDLSSDGLLEETEAVIGRLAEARVQLLEPPEDEAAEPGLAHKKTMIVANKSDSEDSLERLRILQEFFGERLPMLKISTATGEGLEDLRASIYRALDIIRVYTKEPNRPADRSDPVVLQTGSTVLDAAWSIHKDFARNLKYARIWGSDAYDGQRVERTHVLADEDIIEFHIR
jgi:ribosome-interacting GTPase 1